MRYFALALCALFLSGCVTAQSHVLDGQTVIVSGSGGGGDTNAAVQKAMLVEAAKQAQVRGFRFFQVLQADDRSSQGTMVLPGSSSTSGTYGRGGFQYTTTQSPGFVMPYVRPGGEMMVRFFAEPPSGPGVWDAQAILAEVRG